VFLPITLLNYYYINFIVHHDSLFLYKRELSSPFSAKEHGGFLSSFYSAEPLIFYAGDYPIERHIHSQTGSIFFIVDKQSKQSICIKMWEQQVWKLPILIQSQLEMLPMQIEYLIEGLDFNRKYAPDIYLGVATIELIMDEEANSNTVKAVRLGTLMQYPQKKDLNEKQKYALIMRRLNEEWQLNYQLTHGLGNEDGMRFLAHEICSMHKRLSLDAEKLELVRKVGGVDTLLWKLSVNKHLFEETLSFLPQSEQARYARVGQIMELAHQACQELFAQRYATGCIKRCHGDLKATNLWVRPGLKPQLLALDCIDFQPEFCYIDTLSDVAMVVVNIEAWLGNQMEGGENRQKAQKLAQIFLKSYLAYTQETGTHIWPLIEYYMVEKAMVCTFTSEKHYKESDVEDQFPSIALFHAKNLHSLL
jgi:aminoglycoside phosphotransferase family enzyme